MRRACLLISAAVLLAAAPAVAQDPSEQLELTETLTVDSPLVSDPSEFDVRAYEPELGWREATQRTANRARTEGSQGASSVRVIRACEVNLSLGDEDCAGN